MPKADYTAPTSLSIKERQNDPDALRLLLAQRRIHSKAKFWQAIRWFGLLLIGLAAPVISVIWASLAVAMGAIAGGWLFLGRTLLTWRVAMQTAQAAAIQEEFDQYVFDMPETVDRTIRPTLEEIARIAGPDEQIETAAKEEKLLDWYPIDVSQPGSVVVAIAQRANASYSDRLLKTTVMVWLVTSSVWIILLTVASIVYGLTLSTFLMGVVLPLLPAVLDVIEYVASITRASRERGDLARAIESRLAKDPASIDGGDLLVWQSQMFELRRSTPQVPNILYRVTRKYNEAAMNTAADQLGRRAAR